MHTKQVPIKKFSIGGISTEGSFGNLVPFSGGCVLAIHSSYLYFTIDPHDSTGILYIATYVYLCSYIAIIES